MMIPLWLVLTVGSALFLGFYDVGKKLAVNRNSVMPALFLATLTGEIFFVLATLLSGRWAASVDCTAQEFWLIALKSLITSSSWVCVYYAMRELPISIAAPIRASAPLWTFLGSLLFFQEFPTLRQGFGMLVIFAGYCAFTLIGREEGFGATSRGMVLIALGTLLGSGSALYDKFLLHNCAINPQVLQFYVSLDLALVLGAACWLRRTFFRRGVEFRWRWSIPVTGVLLVAADYLYFSALSQPDARISLISLVRRSNVIVTFALGFLFFRGERHWRSKLAALALILAGVVLLAVKF